MDDLRYDDLFDQLPSAVVVFDSGGAVTRVNRAAADLIGVPAAAVIGQDLADHLEPELLEVVRRVLAGDSLTLEGEHHFALASGSHRLRTRWAPLVHDGSTVGGMVAAIGVSPVRPALPPGDQHMWRLDPVTMLPEKPLLVAVLEHSVATARTHDAGLALIWLNIDRFRDVNQALGRPRGDRVLREAGERLATVLRGTDLVCRADADDFLVLLRGAATANHLEALAERTSDVFVEPFAIDGDLVYVTASCGSAAFPQHGQDAETLMENAHTAMLAAKRRGGAACRTFQEEMRVASVDKVRLAADLRQALELDQLEVHYQPQLSRDMRRVLALEALVRWDHPQRGLLLPGEFIPFAEENGLIYGIGRRVVDVALRQLADWRQRLSIPLRLAVNASPREFQRESLATDLLRATQAVGLAAGDVEIEITETAIFADPPRAARIVADLHAAGFSIALDDFGTGFSSLTHLRELRIDRVKIDRSFVATCTSDPTAAAIVSGVVNLAHSLGLETVAEGVERPDQVQSLAGFGCDRLQGLYLAPPLETAACEKYLARHAATAACVR